MYSEVSPSPSKVSTSLMITLLAFLIQPTTSYKILLLCHDHRSHIGYFTQLGKALVSRGHDVTMLLGSKITVPDEVEAAGIHVETYFSAGPPVFHSDEIQDLVIGNTFNYSIWSYLTMIKSLKDAVYNAGNEVLNDAAMMDKLREERFDFAITEPPNAPVFHFVVYELGLPHAMIAVECSYWIFKLPWLPNYVPHFALSGHLSDKMTLIQRSYNTILYVALLPLTKMVPGIDEVIKYAPSQPPVEFMDILTNTSLCLRLRTEIMDTPRPTVPNVINVGGLMGRPGNPLPTDIDKFFETSPHGVILVSFGSWLDNIPHDVILKLAESFTKVKYNVIWKYKGSFEFQYPQDKIKLMTWLPQNDILADSRVKCFVSHCGQSSVLEAVYHGVPMVGLPLFLDQPLVAGTLELKGLLRRIDITNFSADELADAINEVIDGPIAVNMRKASLIFKDSPPGGEVAAYWVEHVIKHGSQHLRVHAVNMPWYQYLMLDVALVITVMLILMIWLCCCCCRYTCRCCCKVCRCCQTSRYKSNKPVKQD